MATNPKDKIFALYNICNTHIEPDYNKSIREVYSDFAKEYIMRAPNLKILKLAGAEYLCPNEYDLPSWAPNWHALSQQHVTASFVAFGEMCGSASSAVFQIEEGERYVTITNDYTFRTIGCILDIVETKEAQMSPTSLELRDFAQKYAWSSCSPLYPTGIPRIQALLRALALDGQPTLMTDHGMPDIDLGSVEGQCLLLLGLFILSGPGEETTIETFKSAFESLGISAEAPFRSFLQQILPGEEIGAVWIDEEAAIQLLLSSSFVATAFTERLLKSCVFFQTLNGYIGVGTKAIEPSDFIAVLPNCIFPVNLRRYGSQFQYIGPCFVLGFMRGEIAELGSKGPLGKVYISMI